MSPRPHPILKQDAIPVQSSVDFPFMACRQVLSPHVHFPPTPWMNTVRFAHSPRTYDRAPIHVSPNICQLPRRGERKVRSPPSSPPLERGRSRGRGRHRAAEEGIKGSYFHPRAYEACEPEPLDAPPTPFELPATPPLVWSPSDESDGPVETPPDLQAAAAPLHTPYLPPSASSLSSPDGKAPSASTRPSHDRPAREAPHTPRTGRTRPSLRRGTRSVGFSAPNLDDGCLGGF